MLHLQLWKSRRKFIIKLKCEFKCIARNVSVVCTLKELSLNKNTSIKQIKCGVWFHSQLVVQAAPPNRSRFHDLDWPGRFYGWESQGRLETVYIISTDNEYTHHTKNRTWDVPFERVIWVPPIPLSCAMCGLFHNAQSRQMHILHMSRILSTSAALHSAGYEEPSLGFANRLAVKPEYVKNYVVRC